MPNIIDYIEWRGDLSFENSPINEIDDIIFARFSYLPFKCIELKDIDTIENIALKMKDLDIENYLWNDDKVFLQKIGNCQRFKDIKVSDSNNDLLDVIANLNKKERIIVFLHYYEGYKIKEIAEMMKLSEVNVKVLLSRTRKKLKNMMEGDNQ